MFHALFSDSPFQSGQHLKGFMVPLRGVCRNWIFFELWVVSFSLVSF
jgi:hypothetical protein